MAISILTQGGTGTQTLTTNISQSVTLSAGAGNRRMFVVVGCEATVPTAVTYGGNSLTLVTDGTTECEQNPDAIGYIAIYQLLHANMPANGAQTLAVTFSAGGDRWAYWFICDGVDQSTNVRSSSVGEVPNAGAAGTTISATSAAALNSNDTNCLLIAGAYKNNNTGTLTLTAPASSTNDQSAGDTPTAGNGLRVSAAHKLGSIGTGSITTTYTLSSSTSRRAIVALLVNPSAGGIDITTSSFTAGSATASATAVRGHPATAAFNSGSASASASAVRGHPSTASSFTAGSASASASAVRGHPATASFTAGTASASTTAVRDHPSTASFTCSSATASTTAVTGHPASASFTCSSATASTTAVRGHPATAQFICSAASFSSTATKATVELGRNVSGEQSVRLTAGGNISTTANNPIISVRSSSSGNQSIIIWTP